MPRLGFEPTTPVFERAKMVHALDRVATVLGLLYIYRIINKLLNTIIVFLDIIYRPVFI
jgi:hypothetical protein